MGRVTLKTDQRTELESLLASSEDSLLQRRARILLLADDGDGSGLGVDEIAERLGIGRALVENTCRRLEQKGLNAALKRRPAEALALPPMPTMGATPGMATPGMATPGMATSGMAKPGPGLAMVAGDRPVDLKLICEAQEGLRTAGARSVRDDPSSGVAGGSSARVSSGGRGGRSEEQLLGQSGARAFTGLDLSIRALGRRPPAGLRPAALARPTRGSFGCVDALRTSASPGGFGLPPGPEVHRRPGSAPGLRRQHGRSPASGVELARPSFSPYRILPKPMPICES